MGNNIINIDMWYDDKISIFFNDCNRYWGNIYKNGKAIGDYTSDNSTEIEDTFKQLCINWG